MPQRIAAHFSLQNDCWNNFAARGRHTPRRGDDVQRLIAFLISLAMAGSYAAGRRRRAEQLLAQARASLGGERA
jgi:hypothetical protein